MGAVEEMMCVLQRRLHSGDGGVLELTLCKYDLRKGDLFVFELGKGATSEYFFRTANVWYRCAQYFVLASRARCLETIDVYIWSMFVSMSVVVIVSGYVGMFIVYRPLLKIVVLLALECMFV